MFANILGDLAIEKIRKDFGDFCATIFGLILYNEDCTLYKINFLIPNINYSILRTSILNLFQHNVLFFSSDLPQGKNGRKNVKILPRLHECIYRIRHFRFMSFFEHEYGEIGKSISKIFFKKGQIFFDLNFKKAFFSRNILKIENVMIQMGRDGLIKSCLNYPHQLKKYNNFFFFKRRIKKPVFVKKNIPWKISTLKLNLGLRMNIIFSVLNQFYGKLFFSTIRSCASKIFNFGSDKIFKTWFSLDTLIDSINDTVKTKNIDQLNLLKVMENGFLNNNSFIFQNSRIKIIFKNFLGIICEKTIQNLIGNQFGKNFLTLFHILSQNFENDEQTISLHCFEEEIKIRKILFKMYRLGFLVFEEKNLSFVPLDSKKKIFFKINLNFIKKRFITEILKTLENFFLRIENFNLFLSKICFFSKNKGDNSDQSLKNEKKGLFLTVSKLDELLLIIYI